jgi:ketosteroid isomerase-like protein
MSQANVEVVKRMIALANRGDIEGIGRLFDPEVECFPASDQPDSTPFRGRDLFLEYMRDWLEVFDRYFIQENEYLDLGEYVVLVGRVAARGRASGAQITGEDAWVYRFRNGKAVEYRECGSKAEALEAVGLSESASDRQDAPDAS